MFQNGPLHYFFHPVIEDAHTAARAYFLCVIGLLLVESAVRLPSLLQVLRNNASFLTNRPARHWAVRVWLHRLFTLPSPAPFLTTLTIASLLRLFVFAGLNLLWGWNRLRYSTDFQLYGWLTLANGGLALLLPTHNNLFSIITRIPAPTLILYHRWAGRATVIHASLHFGLTAQRYIATGQFNAVLQNAFIRAGIAAWVALCLIFLTSIAIVRRRAFEIFSYAHFLFLVFVAGAIYHAAAAPEFLLPGLCLWVVDRIWRAWNGFGRAAVHIKSITYYDGDVVKLHLTGVTTVSPAQMTWIQLPGLSLSQWHPFTIASAPGDKTSTIAMRALGGYTKKVAEWLTDISTVRLDGPYGLGRLHWARYPVVVIVAGGIGITPGVSIASHVVQEALRRGPSSGLQRVFLLWVVKEARHMLWFQEELSRLSAAATSRPDTIFLDIWIHVTYSQKVTKADGTTYARGALEEEKMGHGTTLPTPGAFHVKVGRPDVLRWLHGIQMGTEGSDVAVSVCGPRRMKNDVRKAASRVSGMDGLFFVDEEEFEL